MLYSSPYVFFPYGFSTYFMYFSCMSNHFPVCSRIQLFFFSSLFYFFFSFFLISIFVCVQWFKFVFFNFLHNVSFFFSLFSECHFCLCQGVSDFVVFYVFSSKKKFFLLNTQWFFRILYGEGYHILAGGCLFRIPFFLC